MSKIKSKARNAMPGDRVIILTAPATDTEGRIYPRGSEATPLSFGRDNTLGADYQDLMIDGNKARFIAN
jgi:hypothetical protein